MFESTQITGIRPGVSRYPRYDNAALGFEGFWYPVMFAGRLRKKPIALRLFGEDIMFFRDRGEAHALHDRCPHRGIPLSLGKQEFPGRSPAAITAGRSTSNPEPWSQR